MRNRSEFSLGRFASIWVILAVGFNGVAAFAQDAGTQESGVPLVESAATARVIVKLRHDSTLVRSHALSASAGASETRTAVTARANSLGVRLGINLGAGRAISQHAQVVTATGMSSAALAQRLAAQNDVEYAVVDHRRMRNLVPDDPLYLQGPPLSAGAGGPASGQWYLRAPSGEVAASINAVGAWSLTIGDPTIVVAILDSGVRPDHPDLINRLLPGYDMVSDISTANDGGARDADSSDPGDWVTAAESSEQSSQFFGCAVENSSWHGTVVASILGAASNNGLGMAGVAGGVRLLPVRVLGKCGGYDSDIVAGMQWAAGISVPGVPANPAPARVINMSLSGHGACTQSYLDAFNTISSLPDPAVVVVSAGNSVGHAVGAPGNCSGAIAVAGLRHIGTKVGFSDLGPEIAVSAPGGNCVNLDTALPCLYPILAATNTGTTTAESSSYTDSYNRSVGTSFSAPMVAGTIALMLSVQPTLTPAEVKSALQSSARAFPFRGAAEDPQTGAIQDCHAPNGIEQLQCYCTTSTCGAGMLDAASAVAAALGLRPRISVSQTLHPGEVATLSSAGSLLGNGRSVASVQWQILDGGGIVSALSGGADTAQATLTPGATGRFSVRLTITDDQGLTASAETVVSVLPYVTIAGWNLLGNGTESALEVAAVFGDATKVNAVWRWVNSGNATGIAYPVWAFYTPTQSDSGRAYAASKGYAFLTTINAGEGFWVDAKVAFPLPSPSGAPVLSSSFAPANAGGAGGARALTLGWNQISIGDNLTPGQFNAAISGTATPPLGAGMSVPTNLTSLWAWDAGLSRWYFWAPHLVNNGGLATYLANKNYLDFATLPTNPTGTLSPVTGFWVSMP